MTANWNLIFNFENPLEQFHFVLLNKFNEAFPIRTIKRKNNKPWFTKGLKISARNMRFLHKIRKFFFYNAAFLSYYIKYRNIYRKVIKLAKHSYFQNRIQKSQNKQKESWGIVKELSGTSRVLSGCNLDADDLNSFYCSIAGSLADGAGDREDAMVFLGSISVRDTFFFSPTDTGELEQTCRDIKNKSAAGWDRMSLKVFMNLPYIALCALVRAINWSFSVGNFPQCLKKALVTPLFKGGDTELCSNYRPISLLPTLAKIVERLVKKRMLHFLQRHNLLNMSQFGFQHSKSTKDAIFAFLQTLYCGLNEGEVAAAVFCDLTKAFDCVNHRVLLSKLEVYGFRGRSLAWFASYLSGRSQSVIVNDTESRHLDVTSGVPQGSVLGPLLFLIYINDLPCLNINASFTIFADDTTILWRHRDPGQLEDTVREDLLIVKKWCDSNFLTLNVDKTNILCFKCSINDISLDARAVNNSHVSKFLGLHIDEKLKFDDHILTLNNKLSRGCYALRVVSRELDTSVAVNVYYALIESHLRYGLCFWGCCTDYLFHSVFVLQKRAIRFICRANPRDSCRPLFLSLGILTLASLFILETVCLVHEKFSSEIMKQPECPTRYNSFAARLPIPSTNLIKKSIMYNGRKMFNHLPGSVRQITGKKKFRKVVKSLLIGRVYYSVEEYFSNSFN